MILPVCLGVLNPFFESKGYITPEEFRMFCNETVPLARIQKLTYLNSETFKADLEVAHFGEKTIEDAIIICRVLNEQGDTIKTESLKKDKIEIGNCHEVGSFQMPLSGLSKTGGGKLLVCSIDLNNIEPGRMVSRQLFLSAMNYMNSDSFNPQVEVDLNKIKSLVKNEAALLKQPL